MGSRLLVLRKSKTCFDSTENGAILAGRLVSIHPRPSNLVGAICVGQREKEIENLKRCVARVWFMYHKGRRLGIMGIHMRKV